MAFDSAALVRKQLSLPLAPHSKSPDKAGRQSPSKHQICKEGEDESRKYKNQDSYNRLDRSDKGARPNRNQRQQSRKDPKQGEVTWLGSVPYPFQEVRCSNWPATRNLAVLSDALLAFFQPGYKPLAANQDAEPVRKDGHCGCKNEKQPKREIGAADLLDLHAEEGRGERQWDEKECWLGLASSIGRHRGEEE
jgi:hypothetical protein